MAASPFSLAASCQISVLPRVGPLWTSQISNFPGLAETQD